MKLSIALVALAFVAIAFAYESVTQEESAINSKPDVYGKQDAIAVEIEKDLSGEEHKLKRYRYPYYYPYYYRPVYYGKKHYRGRRAAEAEVEVVDETDLAGEEHKWRKYSRYNAPVSYYYPARPFYYPAYHTQKHDRYYPRYYSANYPRYYSSYRRYAHY